MLSIPASIALIAVILSVAFGFLISLYLVLAAVEEYGFVGAIRVYLLRLPYKTR